MEINPFLPIVLGTLFGVSLVLLVIFSAALLYANAVAGEVKKLREQPPAPPGGEAPRSLPAPVERYLKACGAYGRERIRLARVRHAGFFSPAPDKRLKIEGTQYFSADPPGFVWWGRIRVAPFVHVDGRDTSIGGKGRMLVKASGLFAVADSVGPKFDEGALMRLLGEMVWFPTALADARFVTWTALGEATAAATLTVGDARATLIFRFGPDDLVVSVEGLRWRDVGKGEAVETPWYGLIADYKEVAGVKVPFTMSANWLFDGHALEYARWQVEAVEFDNPALW